ncbi:GNAT family N-acetyltransferase [Roseibium sp.]|uniref:GNAT family N-acetyltransferase n=1 Tax=Roseibium sp. TaxID=1936156 RepID=UPI003A96A6D3
MSVCSGDWPSAVEIREFQSLKEFKQAEDLQRAAWGEGDIPDNADLLLALQSEGGLVAGAFEDERLLAFVFAFPTRDPQVQHSHRLAVHPKAQGRGLGAKLKWFQRDWCLEQGITCVRWTYDPIRSVNASLNIARLGAQANIYYDDYYGAMEGINAGVPSDRILADWKLDSESVAAKARGEQVDVGAGVNGAPERVRIPGDFSSLVSGDLNEALAERIRVRESLRAAFTRGLRIVDFDRDETCYLLG